MFVLVFGVCAAAAAPAAAHAQSGQPRAVQSVPADPAPTPTPSPTPSPQSAPATAPTIDSPPAGSFVGSGSTTVSGTRQAGQEIQLLSPTGGDPLCIVAAGQSTVWTCTRVPLPSGPSVPLRIVVTGEPALAAEQAIAVLAAPVVSGGPTGGGASNGVVRGSGYPNASVITELSSGQRCTSTADGAGAWSCTFGGSLASGPVDVTAVQQTSFSLPSSSNSSAPLTLRFDVDAPAAPGLASPSDSARLPLSGATYQGAGEDGATVTVFAGPYSVCTVVVSGGAWRCAAGGVAAGTYQVRVVQQDPAGNMSGGSPAITVFYGDAPPPTPSAGGASAAPVAPPSGDGTTEAPAPALPAPPPDAALPAPPALPPAHGRDATVPPTGLAGGWNDPTQFATAVLPPGSAFSWLQAALLAFGCLLLLAIPARLLSGTIARARAGRPLWPLAPIAGRNRPRDDFETAPTVLVNRWLVAGAALVSAATLVMLSGPVGSRPAYLRLLVAVMIALLVVNGVGALVPRWWGRQVLGLNVSVTFLPRYLLLVGVYALTSRVFEIHPALLFGLLGSVTIAADSRPERRGQLAAVRAGSLILLAVAGWLALGVLPQAIGLTGAFGAEVANSIVLAAIGSAAIVLVPIGSTSGRSILAWSPPVWAGLTVLAFTIMFAVLSPTMTPWHGNGTITLLWVAAGAFAALSTGAWAWQRFVAPAVD
ncbi:hypothetical protein E3O19_10500 [Cryobacterium algoritolerans]|uniref:Uncharacterized protein n=1 Tax=Cryobacterium algoritolerans TaxID=1259184 RepID=A0A4R8WS21_9MICO|nr:hypothetical protein [Cryobacterium algoritolerans]TFC14619.1 hypothetical protein E3O19_10500 [Cryobacterium algoritolerans]